MGAVDGEDTFEGPDTAAANRLWGYARGCRGETYAERRNIGHGARSRFHHQYGTVHMAQRAIYPNRGLPDTWKRALDDAAEAAFDRAAGKYRKK